MIRLPKDYEQEMRTLLGEAFKSMKRLTNSRFARGCV